MADARDETGSGVNARPLRDTVAGTGPGIADDALSPGADLPDPPSDEEVARVARALGAPVPQAED